MNLMRDQLGADIYTLFVTTQSPASNCLSPRPKHDFPVDYTHRREIRSEQKAHAAHGHGVGNDVVHSPEHQLQPQTQHRVQQQHQALSETIRRLGKEQLAKREPAVEARGDVADFGEWDFAYGDEVFDDPTWTVSVSWSDHYDNRRRFSNRGWEES